MQRKIIISPGEFYHIYNRGVEKRNIFSTKANYERFLKLLYLANGTNPYRYDRVKNTRLKEIDRGKRLVSIGAYVLMPNHFHILIKEIGDGGTSQFLEKLTTGYSCYFNKLNDRVGSLFQGTYKAEHVNNDKYLKYLFAYIHLNPTKLIEPNWKDSKIKNLNKANLFLDNYRYSSYQDYTDINREENLILTKKSFPEYFLQKFEFQEFVDEWLNFNQND